VLKDAAREVYRRLMDRVDPALVDRAERSLRELPGVAEVAAVRLRWIGHDLHAEAELGVGAGLSLIEAHEIAAEAEHRLGHSLPHLANVAIRTSPYLAGKVPT
jgi:divalent metal cation (Fe/Co/Zn/Cd) transporter